MAEAVELCGTTGQGKSPLCYPCALRMSLLFNITPPRLQRDAPTMDSTCQAQGGSAVEPILDNNTHPHFTIVHETAASSRRFFDEQLMTSSVDEKSGTASTKGSTAHGMLGGEDASRFSVRWLCIACFGLYQFMDHIHAPLMAVDVRCTPFLDSTNISININVNRSFTFTWLAVASRYFDHLGTGTSAPERTAIIPEELSSFKDFYMSDLRARILAYVMVPHQDIVQKASPQLLGRERYLQAFDARQAARSSSREAEVVVAPPPQKCARAETYSTVTPAWTAAATQAFSYSPVNEEVILDVFCRHHPTEGLITDEYLPSVYSSNRSGSVLAWGVVYDYALPYLRQIGWEAATPSSVAAAAVPREAATVSCSAVHANIFIMGNYRKELRNLSQSPWFTNGERIGSFSLQELIANPVLPFFYPEGVTPVPPAVAAGSVPTAPLAPRSGPMASPWQTVSPAQVAYAEVFGYGRYKFHSAGREDVDVRMLGTGRPFVLEVISPSRGVVTDEDLRWMERAINAGEGVEVSDLRRTDADVTVRLARHSESKVKHYRCVVWCSRPLVNGLLDPDVQAIHQMTDVEIEQKTPLRVLHRRSLHARPRTIHSMRITPLNEHWMLLDLATQAGTYVKEFVHGDLGRTIPHLGSLLHARTDIVQLDVCGMEMQDLDAVVADASASPN